MLPNGKEIKSENTDEIVCPECGYEFKDSWAYFPEEERNDKEINCKQCFEAFICAKNNDLTYSSARII